MLTDWVLIGRLAREIKERLGGGRVEDAGLLADGRIALVVRRRGERFLMAVDLFASPPLVTVETGELGIVEEPGFVRSLARSLKGMTLTDVAARRFDRLIRLRFSARSRFGVGEELELYLELVPRFGNMVLVKGDTVVSARKEFAPSENPRRAIHAGGPYLVPPLPAQTRTLAAGDAPAFDEVSGEPLYAYYRDGKLLQAYLAPLPGFDGAQQTREPSLLDLFAQLREEQVERARNERSSRRRHALLKRLDERERKLRGELAALDSKRARAGLRDELRAQGEGIFETLHTLDEPEREAAKDSAVKLFAQYKKLGKSLPHIAERERTVNASLEVVETLRWESERSGDEEIDEVESAVAHLSRTETPAKAVSRKRKRKMLELRTALGSRIVVGRSPIENADLTFRVARPNDLWFHAKGVPGAHVILSRDDRGRFPDEDIEVAASLAAFYSKARGAASTPVDYTLRKHVRKQRAAPPGLVWYTHAKTILAQPQPLDALQSG